MRKKTFVRAVRAPVILAAVVLGGCALPVGVQVAFFAFDGLTLAATEKSLAGHGLSAVSGEDCALHRVITADDGEGVCRGGGTALAEASADDGFAQPVFSDPAADYEYAAAEANSAAEERIAERRTDESQTGGEVQTAAAPDTAAEDEPGVELREAEIDEGRYIVIGTYRSMPNAERLALKRRAFEPRVLMTELRSGALYRVVVGPYEEGRQRELTRELAKAGMFDVWAMAVTDEGDLPKVWAPAAPQQIAGTE